MQGLLAALERQKLIVILRGLEGEALESVAQALMEGGVRLLEVAMNSPGALESVASLSSKLGEEALIGAGTVLSPAEARDAVEAGARYLVAPDIDPATLAAAQELGVELLPGVATATEVGLAMKSGAHVVKLFPAEQLGVEWLAALKGPFDKIAFVAVGGLGSHNARAFLKAGAVAVACGSDLIRRDLVAVKDWAGITSEARKLVNTVMAS
jgi:2-dehydro-3-deoxyphosphogluconate aldolase/(4S)-4-hydroxy-2-oxoglutarate aldolase